MKNQKALMSASSVALCMMLGVLLITRLQAVAEGRSLEIAVPQSVSTPDDAQSTTGPLPPTGIDMQGLQAAPDSAVIIPGVPAYLWHHGCGPTAAGMVVGYWDTHGFDALVTGSADTQTSTVNEMMASEAGTVNHYADYSLPIDSYPDLLADKSEDPIGDEHPNNCIADFMKTSQSHSDNYYGWSWFSSVASALKNYVVLVGSPGYTVTVASRYMSNNSLNWTTFRAEMDAGRPMVLLVDTDGNGGTDHFVTAIGYDESGGTQKYACRNTWDTGVHWYAFAPIAPGQAWGIYGGVSFSIINLDWPIRVYLPLIRRN